MKSDMELLLEGSNTIEAQKKLIAALQHENDLLREKLNERARFDIAADQELPSILRRQA